MLSPITLSRPTGHQPKQRLQLYFHKMQCPRHFFMGFTRHPIQNAMFMSFCMGFTRHSTQNIMSTSFFMGSKCYPQQRRIPRESGPPGTANTSFTYIELTCPHVSVSGDHEKPYFIWCHIKNELKWTCYLHFPYVFGSSIITGFKLRPKKKQSPC